MNRPTILVTGSSRGIGKAIALKFANEGYNVIITCKEQKEELEKTKIEIENHHVKCLAFTFDIGDYSACQNMFQIIKQQLPRIDILINNAGISYLGLLSDMSPLEWNHVISTNLNAVYNCCHLVLPDMIQKKNGKIINISSVWGVVGASCEVAYSTAKGGMNSFTKALAKELAPSNIQVNALALGAIDTQMNHFLQPEERSMLIDEIPANRLGTPKDVADFVYQIATANTYLTGQIIAFDGGWI